MKDIEAEILKVEQGAVMLETIVLEAKQVGAGGGWLDYTTRSFIA
jgi:hypothetical protein